MRGILSLFIAQPNWHLSLGMKHAPDIQMGLEFKVENEPRKSFEFYSLHCGRQSGRNQVRVFLIGG